MALACHWITLMLNMHNISQLAADVCSLIVYV